MNVAEFHQNIEQVWQKIEEALENQDCDVDCETQGSVFTITFDDRSQIVINNKNRFLNFGLRADWADSILPIKTMIGWQMMVNAFGIV